MVPGQTPGEEEKGEEEGSVLWAEESPARPLEDVLAERRLEQWTRPWERARPSGVLGEGFSRG